jgi:hypothetical protein
LPTDPIIIVIGNEQEECVDAGNDNAPIDCSYCGICGEYGNAAAPGNAVTAAPGRPVHHNPSIHVDPIGQAAFLAVIGLRFIASAF